MKCFFLDIRLWQGIAKILPLNDKKIDLESGSRRHTSPKKKSYFCSWLSASPLILIKSKRGKGKSLINYLGVALYTERRGEGTFLSRSLAWAENAPWALGRACILGGHAQQ
jgi:hypothetical protein